MTNEPPYTNFSEIIDLWPSCADFGRDIGVKEGTARQMRRRDSVSGEYWARIVEAASLRNFAGVTLEVLAVIASKDLVHVGSISVAGTADHSNSREVSE